MKERMFLKKVFCYIRNTSYILKMALIAEYLKILWFFFYKTRPRKGAGRL